MIKNLPQGWRVEELGNLCNITTGKKDANFGTLDGKYLFFTCAAKPIKSDSYSFTGKSILLAGNGNLENIFLYDGKFEAYQRTYILQNLNNFLLYEYLFYNLKKYWVKYNNLKQYGSIINYIKMENIANYQIPIPPISQQEKIVKVLDNSASLVEQQKQLIEKYDVFLKSKFIEIFGDPITNPMRWETIELGKLGLWKGGGTPPRAHPEFFKGNIPWITTTSLGKLYIDQSNAVEFITNEAILNSATKLIPINSIIIGTRVGVGKVSINTQELCTNQDIMSLTNIVNKVIPIYLYYFISFYNETLKNQQRGATIQGITAPVLKQLEIALPPIDLQNKFASIVEKIEAIKEKETQKLNHLETLHVSLMDKAFKGEIV